MRVARHKVMLPSSSSQDVTVIDDWLYIDYHDRINCLVQIPNDEDEGTDGKGGGDQQQPKFLVFEQTKYALENRNSLAVIGGIIEPHEAPELAARREVEEETGRQCTQMIKLGRFRTDVNRGMGWVHSYLGVNCRKALLTPTTSTLPDNDKEEEEVGTKDAERQDARIITLSELVDAARNGIFLEVQWSNTVALALLHPSLQ
eukprot:11612638-Ditylum_brightwellii.AAC.1